MDDRTSRALVEQARQGDHAAFARLAMDRGASLRAIALFVLRDADLADDAVQDALIRAWRELPRLRDPERFDAWMRRLLVNACHDERRRQYRVLLHRAPLPSQAAEEDGWGRVEDRERIGRAFERLPLDQRVVVVLDHYVGLSDAEIAATLGAPLGTVKSRLRRAMRAMRASLDADERVPAPITEGRVP